MTTHAKPTEHNGRKHPRHPAPILPTIPTVLNAGINQINLFGQTVNVHASPQGPASVTGYKGWALFITRITLPTDASPVLVFEIDAVGPPANWPSATDIKNAPPAQAAQAVLTCRWLGDAIFQTDTTPNPVNYLGGPIVMVGELDQNGNLIPGVAAWQTPDDGDVDYVMVLSEGNVIEVRWLDNAPDAFEKPPTKAHVIAPPSGPGVAGPFGFGSP